MSTVPNYLPEFTPHKVGRPSRRSGERSLWMDSLDPLRALLLRTKHRGRKGKAEQLSLSEAQLNTLMPKGPRLLPINVEVVATVVGLGNIGKEIVAELLRRGCRSVRCYDAFESVRAQFLIVFHELLQSYVDAGTMLPEDVAPLVARLELCSSLGDAVDGVSFIVEAVPESSESKRQTFSDIVHACSSRGVNPNNLVLCSNTMLMPLDQISADLPVAYASRVLGMRFFKPCWCVDDVELTMNPDWCIFAGDHSDRGLAAVARANQHSVSGAVRSLNASQPAYHAIEGIMRSLGMLPVRNTRSPTQRPRQLTADEARLVEARQQLQCARDAAQIQAPAAAPGQAPAAAFQPASGHTPLY